jgi:hypothetical protein
MDSVLFLNSNIYGKNLAYRYIYYTSGSDLTNDCPFVAFNFSIKPKGEDYHDKIL